MSHKLFNRTIALAKFIDKRLKHECLNFPDIEFKVEGLFKSLPKKLCMPSEWETENDAEYYKDNYMRHVDLLDLKVQLYVFSKDLQYWSDRWSYSRVHAAKNMWEVIKRTYNK